MLLSITRSWWVLLIRGIAAILFGIAAFSVPGITLFALVALYGAYALVDGIAAIALGFSSRGQVTGDKRSWGGMVFVGVLGILAGIVTFVWPGITALALLVIIAVAAIIRGIAEIVAAIRLRKLIEHEWMLGLAGVLSIAFGVILLARPLVGALAVVWIIGAYAIVFGVLTTVLAFRFRAHRNRLEGRGGGTRPVVGVA
jgi:uncharacterized membrane protein HdeD (DUF308 family)